MKAARVLLALGLMVCLSAGAAAENSTILIQLQSDGDFRVWHAEGASVLDDEDVVLLDAEAEPGGSRVIATGLGPARAWRTELGVIIEIERAVKDRALLIDRDACGHLKTWHADGDLRLTADQVADLYMSALPGGGPRLALDDGRSAKSFMTDLGAMVAIWTPGRVRR